jgi:hypothetical protein
MTCALTVLLSPDIIMLHGDEAYIISASHQDVYTDVVVHRRIKNLAPI